MNELFYWNNKATFLTLTYDDAHLPPDYGLHKKDLQNFFKRLRKDLSTKIKYFACGEYGDLEGRPHYHAIVFGLEYNSVSRQLVKENWRMCDEMRFNYNPYTHKEQGFATVTADSIRYVCGYVQKKYNGKKAEEEYGERQAPFQLQSQGLGLQFALDNAEALRNGEITFRGHKVSIPRYYCKKLGLEPSLQDKSEFFQRKVDYLKDKGIELDYPVGQGSKFIDYAYSQASASSLAQYERELRKKFSME